MSVCVRLCVAPPPTLLAGWLAAGGPGVPPQPGPHRQCEGVCTLTGGLGSFFNGFLKGQQRQPVHCVVLHPLLPHTVCLLCRATCVSCLSGPCRLPCCSSIPALFLWCRLVPHLHCAALSPPPHTHRASPTTSASAATCTTGTGRSAMRCRPPWLPRLVASCTRRCRRSTRPTRRAPSRCDEALPLVSHAPSSAVSSSSSSSSLCEWGPSECACGTVLLQGQALCRCLLCWWGGREGSLVLSVACLVVCCDGNLLPVWCGVG